jgi:hypothetical protein
VESALHLARRDMFFFFHPVLRENEVLITPPFLALGFSDGGRAALERTAGKDCGKCGLALFTGNREPPDFAIAKGNFVGRDSKNLEKLAVFPVAAA